MRSAIRPITQCLPGQLTCRDPKAVVRAWGSPLFFPLVQVESISPEYGDTPEIGFGSFFFFYFSFPCVSLFPLINVIPSYVVVFESFCVVFQTDMDSPG